MIRWSAILLLLLAWPASAQVVFEPEEPASTVAGVSPPSPPPPPLAPTWSTPQVDFRLVTRLLVDTASEGNGENVAELYRFATASIRTERGPLRLRLTGRLRWVTFEEAPTSGTFLLVNGTNWHSAFEPSLSESYASITHWGVDWTAGLLDIAWGQNPAFSPADVLTPMDFRDGPLVTADARIPVPAVRARGHFGWLQWDAVYLPVFIASRLPLFGNDWSPFALMRGSMFPQLSRYIDPTTYATIEANPLTTRQPQVDLSAPQGGLRLSTRAGPLDVALSWAEFFDHQPELRLSAPFASFLGALQAGDPLAIQQQGIAFAASLSTQAPFSATYLRTRVFAVDAALTAGRLRLTLDAGYSPQRVFPLADLTSTVKPMLSGVIGAEWEGPPIVAAGVYSVMALNVAPSEQLLYLESNPSSETGARNVSLSLAYLTVTERLLDDRLELAFNGIATQHLDYFLMPSIRWHIRDAHAIAAGANLLGGPSGGLGAAYHHNNEAFVEYVLQL